MRGWSVSITIEQAGRRMLAETALPLPVRMLRDADSAAVILLDGAGVAHTFAQGRTDVSRQHMTLTAETDGTLVIADQSTNGVFLTRQSTARLIGRGKSVAIPAQMPAQLDTVGFDIHVQSQPPRAPRVDSRLHAEVQLGAKMYRMALDREPLVVSEGALMSRFTYERHGDLDGIVAALGGRSALVIAPGRDGQMHSLASDGFDAHLNRRRMEPDQPQPVSHGVLISFAGGHLHLLQAGAARQLACANGKCLMLNDYAPGQNCVYCGSRLGDAHTRFIGQGDRA